MSAPAARQPKGSQPEAGPHARQLWIRSGGLSDGSPDWRWERFVWMTRLHDLAAVLDRRRSTGEDRSRRRSTRILGFAFDKLMVLVDPEWWRTHPPRDLSPEEESRLDLLRENRQRMLSDLPGGGWSLLAEILHPAVEAFYRAAFTEGLADCLRLLDMIVDHAAAGDPVN